MLTLCILETQFRPLFALDRDHTELFSLLHPVLGVTSAMPNAILLACSLAVATAMGEPTGLKRHGKHPHAPPVPEPVTGWNYDRCDLSNGPTAWPSSSGH